MDLMSSTTKKKKRMTGKEYPYDKDYQLLYKRVSKMKIETMMEEPCPLYEPGWKTLQTLLKTGQIFGRTKMPPKDWIWNGGKVEPPHRVTKKKFLITMPYESIIVMLELSVCVLVGLFSHFLLRVFFDLSE